MDTMKDTTMQPATDAVIDTLRKMQPTAWVYEDMLGRKCVGFERPLHRRNTHKPLFSAATHAVVMGLVSRLEEAEKDIALKESVIDALGSELNAVANERDALRAKIEQMEKQKPVAWMNAKRDMTFLYGPYNNDDTPLYALPGAQVHPAPSVPREAIEKMLTQLMDIAVSNGANSVSMPDEYVEVAAWLCGIPAQPAPSVNEGVRKVTLDFRWESEAQHHIPTIKIEFDPVSPDSPNDAKGWQDRDRIASMLTPEDKP